MSDFQTTTRNFNSLSVKDLLEARDQYHFQLINKSNVVGTAIGLYLVRNADPWPSANRSAPAKSAGARRPKPPRTFSNSSVRDYSWPCVLVLVDDWVDESGFGASQKYYPTDMVPKTLYLADGRAVPVCVVLVEPVVPDQPTVPSWYWSSPWFGAGYPLVVDRQGVTHHGTVGCLVSDGHTTYAVTNRHVCGAAGEPIFSLRDGRRVRIGRASDKQITRLDFNELYPDFVSKRTYVNLDVGLVEVDDLSDWTSVVHGLGPIGDLAELNTANIGLNLVNARVEAFGGTSGKLSGEIAALFYRYKSVAGYDYVADFLIAPATGQHQTQPGDSGTIWHLVGAPDTKTKARLRPLAVEWGGQALLGQTPSRQFRFAVATSLVNACRWLDVQLVRDIDTGVQPYWGQTGHYSIANFACSAVDNVKLKKLMQANVDRVSFASDSLDAKKISAALKEAKTNGGFIPLADVPDIVWKNLPSKMPGGRDTKPALHGSTGPEHPTHFADIDEPAADGVTLRARCIADPAQVDVDVWRAYYTSLGHADSTSRGLIPFRVWQFFDAMVAAIKEGRIDKFVCAAGLVAHYTGDACQPLHGSMNSDGYKDQPTTVTQHHKDGSSTEVTTLVGAGVHSTYETNMVDRFGPQLVAGIGKSLASANKPAAVGTGREVAVAIVQLMDRSATLLPPSDIIDTYVKAGAKNVKDVQTALWDQHGQQTIELMADGARVLAFVWQSAWTAGGGDTQFAPGALGPVDTDDLMTLYQDPKFVPSLDLDSIKPVLVEGAATAARKPAGGTPKRVKPATVAAKTRRPRAAAKVAKSRKPRKG